MLDDAAAFSEYEAGNMDYANVPSADIDRVKADPVLSAEFKITPSTCSYFYGFNTTAPVVSDVRVRRALSMAVDRQGLIDNVTKGGQQPAQWFDRPGLAGSPTKVFRVQAIVLTKQGYTALEPTETGVRQLIHELVVDRTLG